MRKTFFHGFKRWPLIVLTTGALLSGCGDDNSSSRSTVGSEVKSVKNVFLMITDGASLGAWDSASLIQHGVTTGPEYFEPEFDKYLMTTYPLNTSSTPTGGQVAEVSYDPTQAWSLESYNSLAGYIHQNFTDSAAAGTALSTGHKTYNNAMNWSNDPAATGSALLPTMPEVAKQQGKVVGTISSVQWSHATPAALSNAHNISRNNYAAIANAILDGAVVDVAMGAGNPQWNDNGEQTITTYDAAEITDAKAKYVGGRNSWIALNEGSHPGGWALVQEKTAFAALAEGDLTALAGKSRLLGTVQAGSTLQQSRGGYDATDTPFSDRYNTTVPSLQTMTKAALNCLSALDQGNGIFLHIEGGAIDWAAHANQTARIVEEQTDFNNAVNEVISWIEANGGWEENLLIITTDHGNAMPMGPDSDVVAHDRIELDDILAGQYKTEVNEQGVRWWSGNHTNELVPLFVRGFGAEYFAELVDGTDNNFAAYYPDWIASGFDGRYIDNTDLFKVYEQATAPAL